MKLWNTQKQHKEVERVTVQRKFSRWLIARYIYSKEPWYWRWILFVAYQSVRESMKFDSLSLCGTKFGINTSFLNLTFEYC